MISCRKRSFIEIVLLRGLGTWCKTKTKTKNLLFKSPASYALLGSSIFKSFIKGWQNEERSFLFCYCFLQREIFLKAVQPLSPPLTPAGEGVSCLIGGLGRGPGHLWLCFCPSLVFEVCLQIASVLSARSHSANLGLVAWPWAWGLVNHKPVSTVTCSRWPLHSLSA